MSTGLQVRWPDVAPPRAFYESLFLRAVDPATGEAVWLRHTVQHRPGDRPGAEQGSAWCVVWDADGTPEASKRTWPGPRPGGPEGPWITVGGGPDAGPEEGGSALGPEGARGAITDAAWDLRFGAADPVGLRHLPFERLYGAPLPKTKVTSPLVGLAVSGTVRVGERAIELRDAPAVLGHNWGSEHAHRWLWLNGLGFRDRPDAWFDAAVARIKVGPVVVPWAGVGALQLDGRRIPLALSARRGPGRVRAQSPGHLVLELPAADGSLLVELDCPPDRMVAWPYAQPGGGELHHALNCSRAAVRLTWSPRAGAPVVLESPVGGVLEQGVPEHDPHPVAVLPFADG
ncbi:hypothetical protein [Patulibacter defluvii]|uniref:hypothetical protein n=1 Tax=Patulibacter defluvii TaxID=3095358 RepID=UPI002A75B56B|nr:hypothetical protein [Patulibacter sp. DM4]